MSSELFINIYYSNTQKLQKIAIIDSRWKYNQQKTFDSREADKDAVTAFRIGPPAPRCLKELRSSRHSFFSILLAW